MIINPVLYQQGVKLPELENPGAAADLLSGKQLVDQYGNPLTGTMPQKSASDLTASGASIIVPAGYYPEQVSKSVATATHPKPTLSRSGGTITAKHVQEAGYTEGGTTTETLSITTQAGKTVTPGTSRQTAVASGRLTTGAVYVAGDTNLKAENIKSGVSIFGVAGSAVSAASPITCRIYNNVGSNLDVMYFESDFISNPIETVLPSSGNIQIQTLPNAPIIIYPSAIGTSLDREVLDKGPNSLNCATAFLFREYDTGAYKGAYYRSTVFVFSAAGSLYVTIR